MAATTDLVVAVVGATATGKTDVAAAIAERLDAEVVCADSRQVYRELEIGTGKPTPAERAARPHHLFEAVSLRDADVRPSAGWYARAARGTCAAIHARGRPVVLVGGSGLYLEAAHRGLAETPPHDPEVRQALAAELDAHGPEALHALLRRDDPETAARLMPRDRQRITRALEVLRASGRPLSWWLRRQHGPAVAGTWRTIEIGRAPSVVSRRIEARTAWMFSHGLVEEVRGLLEDGLGPALHALRAVGYDEATGLVEGRLSREEAEARTSARTRQLAKRQRTWFRHRVEALRIDADALDERALLGAVLAAASGRGL